MKAPDLTRMELVVGPDDWRPTPHGQLLAETLAARNLVRGKEVLELGGGVGNHTILLVRQGAARVVTTEITEERLETTRRNVAHNCPEARQVEYRVADWLATEGTFDVIVTNPPFARSGQRNRRYYLDALILNAHKRLKERGEVVFVQSSMADLGRTLRELERNRFRPEVLAEREGPFRDYYFEDPTFMQEIKTVPDGYEVRDSTYYETLYVIRGQLLDWTSPPTAHVPDTD